MLLTLWPTSVAAGTLFTIECRVPAVAPLEGLTVTLLRGTEILYIQTFVGTAPSLQDAVVSHNTTAHREDGHHNFSCEAQMDLRSRGGGLVHRVSDPQRLEVKGEGEPTDQEGVPSLSALRGRKRLCPALCQLRGGTRGNDTWSLGFPGAPGEFLAWTLTSCLVMSELGDLNQVKLLSLALTPLSNDKFDLTDPEGPLESRFCDPRWSRSSLSSESLAKAPSSLPREGLGLDLATVQTMRSGSAWQGHHLSPSALMVSQRPAGGPDPGPPSLQ